MFLKGNINGFLLSFFWFCFFLEIRNHVVE